VRRVLVLLLLARVVPAAEPEAYLDRDEVLGLATQFKLAENWALKGLVLLALGPKWHPAAAPFVAEAVRHPDDRVRPFAIEALLATDEDALRRVASRELVDALVFVQAKSVNRYFGERARRVLGRIAPAAGATNRTEWVRWWDVAGSAYEPLRWTEPERKRGGRRTVARGVLERAFDLQAAGLEIVICIDSTGSMQSTIDLARDAVLETVDVLGAIAPRFRIGLVTYRDDGDLPGGAKVLSVLTTNARAVRTLLGRLRADGGGDAPERVEKGLELSLDRRMGWNRDTNKVVIVVGDAPPKDLAAAVKLAREAHERPFAKTPTTGRKGGPRPFVVSAIAVGPYPVSPFTRIAKAGGGSVSQLSTSRAPKGVRRVTTVVKHVLTLAFGERWQNELGAFVRVFDKYREAKYYR